MKIRKAFEQKMKVKQLMSFNGTSLYAMKRRAKRICCCYYCARLNCNSVYRENGKRCNGLFVPSIERLQRRPLVREPMSKTKEIWFETGYTNSEINKFLLRQK